MELIPTGRHPVVRRSHRTWPPSRVPAAQPCAAQAGPPQACHGGVAGGWFWAWRGLKPLQPWPENGGGTDQAAAPPLLPTAPATPTSPLAPGSRDQDAARSTAPESAKTGSSRIAVVSLLLGRRRASHHWLITAHGDPAGLATRLQGRLAPFAPSTCAPTSPPTSAQVEIGGWGSPGPVNGAGTTTSSKAGAVPRAESGPDCLWQRAFSDCTALAQPEPPSEASYRYRLSLSSGRLASASMACWRRYSPGGPWQRRCGPMSLATFLRHYGAPPDQPKQVHLY